LISLTIPLT